MVNIRTAIFKRFDVLFDCKQGGSKLAREWVSKCEVVRASSDPGLLLKAYTRRVGGRRGMALPPIGGVWATPRKKVWDFRLWKVHFGGSWRSCFAMDNGESKITLRSDKGPDPPPHTHPTTPLDPPLLFHRNDPLGALDECVRNRSSEWLNKKMNELFCAGRYNILITWGFPC